MTNPTRGLGGGNSRHESKPTPKHESKKPAKKKHALKKPEHRVHTIITRKVGGGLLAENYGGGGDPNNPTQGYSEHILTTPAELAGHFDRHMPFDQDGEEESEPAEPELTPEAQEQVAAAQ